MKLSSKFINAKTDGPICNNLITDNKVMVLMHGLGDSMAPYEMLAQEINLTGLNYLLLNAPDEYYTGFAWYSSSPQDPEQVVKSPVQLIINELDALIHRGFKAEDIFLAGFSQGGCMALCTALSFSEKLAGVVALSPKTYPFMVSQVTESFLATPLFIAHGKQDAIIPFGQTKAIVDQFLKNHNGLHWQEYSMSHEIDISEIADLRVWLNELL